MNYIHNIAKLIDIDGLEKSEIERLVVKADSSQCDYTLPCFKLSKLLHKAPKLIAEELACSIIKPDFISEIKAVNGYLNFHIDVNFLAKSELSYVIAQSDGYGSSTVGNGKTVCIDYSSINIAKPFHMGHLSTTVIGSALYKLYKTLGYNAVGINHLGDWGTQFGKLIVAFKLWGNKSEIEEGGTRAMQKIYVRFHQEAKENPALDDEARAWFKKIEDNDKEAMELFEWFKQITMKEVAKIYDRLGVSFDSYAGESFYNDKMQTVLDELEAKGLLTVSDGAKVVELEDMPPCLLVKADGATLYATRDLAAAFYRKKTYNFYKSLYVVAYQQNLHFKQWFKVVEMMGYPWSKSLEHVAFGMVSLPDGSMSTREGKVVYLEDVINSAIDKALTIITAKSPDLENKEEIAESVGVGAVIFSALINNRIKDIVFSYDSVLNFDGETCPYVQYTFARCYSLLDRAKDSYDAVNFELDEDAKQILLYVNDYPDVLIEACNKNEPSMITRHLVDLCELYNSYYFAHRILDEKEPMRSGRIMLTKAVSIVIKNGLAILGIKAPNKM